MRRYNTKTVEINMYYPIVLQEAAPLILALLDLKNFSKKTIGN